MAKTNKADMSCARVKQYTAFDVSKAERHNERKNETYENMNVITDGTRVQRLSAWRIRKYSRAFNFPAISNPTGQRTIGEVAEAYSKGTG